MEFFRCSIAGVSYGQGVTEVEVAAAIRSGSEEAATTMRMQAESELKRLSPTGGFEKGFNCVDRRLLDDQWVHEPDPKTIERFFKLLAVCHTIVPEGERLSYAAAVRSIDPKSKRRQKRTRDGFSAETRDCGHPTALCWGTPAMLCRGTPAMLCRGTPAMLCRGTPAAVCHAWARAERTYDRIGETWATHGTATEHLDRSIEVIYLRAAHVLPILSYLPVSRYSPRREYHKSAGGDDTGVRLVKRGARALFPARSGTTTADVIQAAGAEPDLLKYQAESPDELAFAIAARTLGFTFTQRTANKVCRH
eukprot:640736-Prorocentrum_minimum.AAC.1